MSMQTIRFVDSAHNPVAVATVADVGDHFAGTIDLADAPPAVLAVFREFEEVVNGQMFSFLDEVEAKVAALGLCVELSAGTFTALKDLQIYPSRGEVSFKLAVVPAMNATV